MKRKTAVLVGNILMVLGLIAMIGSLAVNLSSHVFSLNLPDMITMGSLFGIFVGAMIWLAGARLGGRDKVADRYWLIKHYHDSKHDNHRYPQWIGLTSILESLNFKEKCHKGADFSAFIILPYVWHKYGRKRGDK